MVWAVIGLDWRAHRVGALPREFHNYPAAGALAHDKSDESTFATVRLR